MDPSFRWDDGGNTSVRAKRRWIPAFAGMTAVLEAIVVFKAIGVFKATVKFPPSSRRKPGSSVFRRVPKNFFS